MTTLTSYVNRLTVTYLAGFLLGSHPLLAQQHAGKSRALRGTQRQGRASQPAGKSE